jgi:hypothetical protein
MAVDIKKINGLEVGDEQGANPAAAGLVSRVQGIAMGMAQMREDYGPLGLWKRSTPGGTLTFRGGVYGNIGYFADSGASGLWFSHQNHVHIGFYWGQ